MGYCERYPDDKGTCGLVKQLPALAPGMSEKDYLEVLQKTFTRWGKTGDPRIAATNQGRARNLQRSTACESR